jgi:phosphohistidine phosphatase
MKTLTLVRHAKSDWTYDLPDHDRPLNKRGKSDLPVVADRLNQFNCSPDVCYFSSARRATDTANGLLDYMNVPSKREQTEELYTFDAGDLLHFIKSIDDGVNHAMIVSHNPGSTDLINRISNINLDNLPTCGYAQFSFDIMSWSEIETVKGDLDLLEYPKMIGS